MAPWLALEDGDGPTVDTSKAAFEMAGIGPDDIDLAQLQGTEAGAEIMHMAKMDSVNTASRNESYNKERPK
ncbi:MAG: hypothetical protein Ct9H90mP30_2000 [Actinomycetota bacterium]|nr:MAG: hypothetical protein Ct9H90mP30_2000 [Actinomycetota bacterium]